MPVNPKDNSRRFLHSFIFPLGLIKQCSIIVFKSYCLKMKIRIRGSDYISIESKFFKYIKGFKSPILGIIYPRTRTSKKNAIVHISSKLFLKSHIRIYFNDVHCYLLFLFLFFSFKSLSHQSQNFSMVSLLHRKSSQAISFILLQSCSLLE